MRKITVNHLLKMLKEIKETHSGDCVVNDIDIHGSGTAVTIYHACGEAAFLGLSQEQDHESKANKTNRKNTKTKENPDQG